jgi:hypothetical protein
MCERDEGGMCKSLHYGVFFRGASGEAMTGRAQNAAGPFVRRERTLGSTPSTATTAPPVQDGTRFCEDRWKRFDSSRWHERR